jgi:hypothetical protein
MDLRKLEKKFEEAERNHMKNDIEMVKAQLSISAKLQPLTRDGNRIREVEDVSDELLIKESIQNKKMTQKDFSNIREQFRKVMNDIRF